ncbi:MAG: alpha-amylase family glycosyl hydrolase [Eubacteriales bacterium]|nr:alpha-amylase family glycosyl hydrolase [Eubacteriales bacterium]
MRKQNNNRQAEKGVPFYYEYAAPQRMGVCHRDNGYLFGIRVPDGQEAELLLYRSDEEEPCQRIPLTEEERIGEINAVWVDMPEVTAASAPDAVTAYNYRIGKVIMADPYSESILEYTHKESGRKELRTSLRTHLHSVTKPLEIPYEDCIFYKAHVKGFTAAKPAGVRHPGTFAGIRERIPYLKELGINALILMPVYEFFETGRKEGYYELDSNVKVMHVEKEKRRNYWGYADGFYFAPKKAYSETEDPAVAFASLVDELHKAGIECIPEFYFPPEMSGGKAIDVLSSWRMRFHVDGFHLLGEGGWIDAVTSEPLLKKTKLIHTGFSTGAMYGGKPPYFRNLGVMNLEYEHSIRRFLKGEQDQSKDELAWIMRRNPEDKAFINYIVDQDGFTLADMVSYERKCNDANGENNRDGSDYNLTWNCGEEGPSRKTAVKTLREQQMRNAIFLMMTAQGAPMLYAGDEVMNTQDGNNNAWCQDNPLGWVTWKRTKAARQMQSFVKEAIRFRKEHPILHMKKELRMGDYKGKGIPDLSYHSQVAWMAGSGSANAGIGMLYCGAYAEKADGTSDDTMYIAYNLRWEKQMLAIPKIKPRKKWYEKVNTFLPQSFYADGEEPEAELIDEKYIEVPARTILVLVAK